MARVTYGESITEYAGSIGGVTFLRNASGPIAKLRSNPTVNPSPYQATHQGNLATLVAYWPTLSQENKDAWDDLAAAHKHTTPWGVEKTLSGYQWFISLNLRILHGANPIIDIPFQWYAPPPPPQFTIEVSSTYIRCVWDPAYQPDQTLFFYTSLPLRQSSIKLRRSLFYITRYYRPPPISTFDLTPYLTGLYNITWSTFFASANCSIIVRILHGYLGRGWRSAFTSAIVKIG